MIVQAFITKLPIEALDVSILGGLARSDELEIDAALVSPAIKRAAREFRSLVGSNRPRQAAELSDAVEHARDISARNPVIDGDVEAFAGEVIDDRQALVTCPL